MPTIDFNSMPQNISDGFRDKSVPDPILLPRRYATHIPLWLIWAKKGPLGRVMADGAVREQLYGTETFMEGSKYFTHQTLFSNHVNSKGNQGIYQRLVAPNAKKAGLRLSLDVLKTQVPTYQTGSDGKYLLDELGDPIPTGQKIPGVMVKLVRSPIDAASGGEFGQASQMRGDQVITATQTQSTRYPLMDVPVTFLGKYGDDLGLRLWAPTHGSRVTPDQELLEKNKAYPYVFACMDRSSDTVQNIQTVAGTQEITCVFKRNQVKKSVGGQDISFETRFHEMYNDRERTGIAPLYGPFDEPHLYYDNLVELLKMFYDLEQPYIDMFSDFDGSGYTDDDEGEIHLFNFISGKSSKGAPYRSFIINRTDANAEAMSAISTVWAEGGDDGDMDLDTFNKLVAAEMRKYGDINQEVTENRLGNPESIFYDSGFDADTKMDLANFIAVRKDTILIWCLTDAQGTTLTADEESSMAIALFTRGQMLPESTEFGTPSARFAIVACDGRLIGSNYKRRAPLSLELASKSAEYMGAGTGLWNTAMRFSHGDRAEVKMFRDINVLHRPIAARQRDWANGMIYVQKKDLERAFFPGLRSGYPNERSVAASLLNVFVFADLQKVADRIWSEFSGATGYSNEQFKKYVEAEFRRQVEGKYDNSAALVGTVNFTAVDEYNGYSWTLNIDAGFDNMKVVQYTLLTGYRRESMPTN